MNNNTILLAILFPLLILVQVLICNHIMLFNVAVPFIFIYFIIRFPIGVSQNLALTLSFLLGFFVDLFSDTPGLNALACTLLVAIRPAVFYSYVTRDDKTKRIVPSISSIGWQDYSKYLISMCGIFCLMVFGIEYFSFASIGIVLLMTISSAVLTFLVIIGIDCLLPSFKNSMA